MVNIKIHIVKAQILEAGVNHLRNVLLAGDAGGDFLLGSGQELGGNHHILPFCKIPYRPAHILLAGSALIADGGVEEVDPQLQSAPNDLTGVGLIQRPAVLAVGCIAKAHATHADAGNRQVGVS